jgi:adenylate cyclase class IV
MNHVIEVELRGLLTKEQYDSLIKRLEAEGILFEADDKDTYFFNVQKGIFKVCDEISKDQGKLSLKIGSEETGALKEKEIIITREQVPAFIEFFNALGYAEPHHVPQQRKNFFLKDATLSLKFTPDFQFHFELEGKLLEDETLVETEKKHLKDICDQYGIVPLQPEEITERVKEIRKRIGFDK